MLVVECILFLLQTLGGQLPLLMPSEQTYQTLTLWKGWLTHTHLSTIHMLADLINATALPAGVVAVVEHALDTHHQMDNLGDSVAAQEICVGTIQTLSVELAHLIVITG